MLGGQRSGAITVIYEVQHSTEMGKKWIIKFFCIVSVITLMHADFMRSTCISCHNSPPYIDIVAYYCHLHVLLVQIKSDIIHWWHECPEALILMDYRHTAIVAVGLPYKCLNSANLNLTGLGSPQYLKIKVSADLPGLIMIDGTWIIWLSINLPERRAECVTPKNQGVGIQPRDNSYQKLFHTMGLASEFANAEQSCLKAVLL